MSAWLRRLGLLVSFSICAGLADDSAPTVVSVSVPGTALAVKLSTQVGQPFDPSAVTRDLRYLWGLGKFDDVRVETESRDGGVAVVFRAPVTPHLMLRDIRMVPHTYGLEIHEPPETPITSLRAHQIAEDAERQLREGGYAGARVNYDLKLLRRGYADLKLNVDIGEYVKVTKVRFEGDRMFRGKLEALKIHRIVPGIPHVWDGWRLLPAYSVESVDADAAHIRALYVARGYFDAEVRPVPVEFAGKRAIVTLVANRGQPYPMDRAVCSSLLAQRREAQRDGVLDFSASIDEAHPEETPAVTLGPEYRVGHIEFRGNHRYNDETVRRNLLVTEGEILDEHMLRVSMARLNRANLFETISAKQVEVNPDEKTGLADVTFHVRERKIGSWRLSGPVGPMSLAGPVEAAINARLPAWGRGLLELSTYSVSMGAFAFGKPLLPIINAPKSFTPIFFIQRPFTPGEGWLSGFSYAPRLGWKDALFQYGGTQARERLMPLVSGERGVVPDLKVTVKREDKGDTEMICEAPGPKLRLLRVGVGLPLRLLGAFPF